MSKSSRRGHGPETSHRAEPSGAHAPGDDHRNQTGPSAPRQDPAVLHEATRLLREGHTPSAVVVDDGMDVLQSYGQGRHQFAPGLGKPGCNLLTLVKGRLAMQVRAAVATARQSGAAVKRRGSYSGPVRDLEFEVIPLGEPGQRRHFLILFHEQHPPSVANLEESQPRAAQNPAQAGGEGRPEQEIERLRQELDLLQRCLQAAIETQDAGNEEIKNANRAILSSNKELQAAGEALRSSNEDLIRVGQELQTRNAELTGITRDLAALINALEFAAVVLLTGDGRIRRFTAAAGPLFNLVPADIGRPFNSISPDLQGGPDPKLLVDEAIRTATGKQSEMRDAAGRWYRMNVQPCLTPDHKVDGAVVALVDIDDLKRSATGVRQVEQEVLAISEREQRRISQELHDGLGQHLTAISFVAQTIVYQLQQLPAMEVTGIAEQLVAQVSEAASLTRNLAKGLHPAQIKADQFATMMQTLAGNVSNLFKVVCTFRGGPPHPPPANTDNGATQLYRITQEAIHNALKHGKATRITIDYHGDPDGKRARLFILDDGCGLEESERRAVSRGGMGLQIMRYRAESIGGRLRVERGTAGGTLVTVDFGGDAPSV